MSSLFFLAAALLWPSQLRVEVRNSEVWLTRDGQEFQLTHDGKSKWQAVLSPAQDRIAYYEVCPQSEHCTPEVVVLDLEGHRTLAFQPKPTAVPSEEPCGSIDFIAWANEHAIASTCHVNPSLSEYIETDLPTGKTVRDLLGYDFTVSPDGKEVAHVGWIRHFAPPYAQSNYLQINRTTIYPLPKGMGPVEQEGLSDPPEVVRQEGLNYRGIHEFLPGMAWSPDSQRIALVECVYDWTANHPDSQSAGDGKYSNRECSLAVVSMQGAATLIPLTELSVGDFQNITISWSNAHELSLRSAKLTKTVAVPGSCP
ncbi:MAG TPA: hypothetical protein VJN93_13190 [Candidatus Acidoferrum sp.]|nr:hypothetical protein [Candidatus Acidoferrum sp.]